MSDNRIVLRVENEQVWAKVFNRFLGRAERVRQNRVVLVVSKADGTLVRERLEARV
jgi:hypothetical protein